MLGTETDRPGVDEQYTTAANAKSLLTVAHHAGAVDVLAAAAWSTSRLGGLLMRLQSEYDGGQRTRSTTRTDATLMTVRLRSLPQAIEQLAIRAAQWGMEAPEARAKAAILWWLDHVCRACHGRRWRTINDTPHLSGDNCPSCRGAGEIYLPYGQDGRRLVGLIEECLNDDLDLTQQRLRGLAKGRRQQKPTSGT